MKRKLKRIYSGFTLIELLIAVGVLAILLSIVLIAINPIEQFNKASDLARLTAAKDFTSAINYHYAYGKKLPWSQNSTCRTELKSETTLNQIPTCIKNIVNSDKAKDSVVVATESKDINITECNNGVALCFNAKSSSFKKGMNAKYTKNGVVNPNCADTNNSSEDCYVCSFSTNQAQECFQALNPNGSLTVVSNPNPKQILPITEKHSTSSCKEPTTTGSVSCMAEVVSDSTGDPLSSIGLPGGFGPEQIHKAYNLPCTPGGAVGFKCDTPSAFGPQIIAIVNAFHAPNIESDLAVYNQAYGLPPCTKANGCLTVVNQNGQTSPLPVTTESAWAMETSMDVEIAHAVCQTCKILLVEANSNYFTDLGIAVNRAAAMGATAISNSYGGSEYSGSSSYDSYYNHPGVFVTASSGDWGYGSVYPAANKNVIAVGGTTLSLLNDFSYSSEKVWGFAGSGCSGFQLANSFQTGLSNWGLTGCGLYRGIADVSAVADPSTGAAIYDSTPYSGTYGWWIMGGTSLSSPIIAATLAMTGNLPINTYGSNYVYANSWKFRDITIGSNGSCGGKSICTAGIGYDGPTGLGTPNLSLLPSPTPTIAPTPTTVASPSATPTFTPTPTIVSSQSASPTPTPSTYFMGACEVRDSTITQPGYIRIPNLTTPDLGTGYAKIKKINAYSVSAYDNTNFMTVIKQLWSLCTQSVNVDLMKSYCSMNSKSAYWEVVVYKPDGTPFGNGNNPINQGTNSCASFTSFPGLENTKLYKTYAMFAFDKPTLFGPNYHIDVSLTSNFAGTSPTGIYRNFASCYDGEGGTPTSPSEKALRKLTDKLLCWQSQPNNYSIYSNQCGKTLYWRVVSDSDPTKYTASFPWTVDCTTKVNPFVNSNDWYKFYPYINADGSVQAGQPYDSAWDPNGDLKIDWTDYWILAMQTKSRFGGWTAPE